MYAAWNQPSTKSHYFSHLNRVYPVLRIGCPFLCCLLTTALYVIRSFTFVRFPHFEERIYLFELYLSIVENYFFHSVLIRLPYLFIVAVCCKLDQRKGNERSKALNLLVYFVLVDVYFIIAFETSDILFCLYSMWINLLYYVSAYEI